MHFDSSRSAGRNSTPVSCLLPPAWHFAKSIYGVAEPANNAFQSIRDPIYLEKTFSVYILNTLSTDHLIGVLLVPFNLFQTHRGDSPASWACLSCCFFYLQWSSVLWFLFFLMIGTSLGPVWFVRWQVSRTSGNWSGVRGLPCSWPPMGKSNPLINTHCYEIRLEGTDRKGRLILLAYSWNR